MIRPLIDSERVRDNESERGRRKATLARGSCVAVLLFALVSVAYPQAYPVKPIRMVTPTAAGGGSDILARLIGAKLAEKWGQQVVVDNRPGAGSIIGTDLVAKAPADGYTLLLVAVGHAINATLYAKLPYDTLRDFSGVIMLSSTPSVLVVNPELPVRSVGELIAYAKARPGRLNYGSSGIGMSAHLAMELF